MPDDRMWIKFIGIPSGSCYTQIIGSICNYITMMYVQLQTSISGKALRLVSESEATGASYAMVMR